MNTRKRWVLAVGLSAMLATAAVNADDKTGAILGGAVGGATGAYIGQQVGGPTGGIVGAAIGGGAGAGLGADYDDHHDDDDHRADSRSYRYHEDDWHPPGKHKGWHKDKGNPHH